MTIQVQLMDPRTEQCRLYSMRMLRRLLGPAWMPGSEEQLAKALREVKD